MEAQFSSHLFVFYEKHSWEIDLRAFQFWVVSDKNELNENYIWSILKVQFIFIKKNSLIFFRNNSISQ